MFLPIYSQRQKWSAYRLTQSVPAIGLSGMLWQAKITKQKRKIG
jgi:hypothetical protein